MFTGKKLFKGIFQGSEESEHSESESGEETTQSNTKRSLSLDLDELVVKLESADSNSSNLEEKSPEVSGSSSAVSTMTSLSIGNNDYVFTLFNFHPVTTTLKLPELKSSESGDYRSWRSQLRSITLGYGLDCLIFM